MHCVRSRTAKSARVIRKQEEVGLHSVTDGEFRRFMWHKDFIEHLDGVQAVDDEPPVMFMGMLVHPINPKVTGKVGFSSHPQIDHFQIPQGAYTPNGKDRHSLARCAGAAQAAGPAGRQQPAPIPIWKNSIDDLGAAYRKAIQAFYDAGCRYLQIDEVRLVVSPRTRPIRASTCRAMTVEALTKIFAGMLDRVVREKPADMTISMHTCRGNFRSRWAATGGYEPVAEASVQPSRASTPISWNTIPTAPAASSRCASCPRTRSSCSGLITTKTAPARRQGRSSSGASIEAAKYVDPCRGCGISPQCRSFASTEEGNDITEDDQWR